MAAAKKPAKSGKKSAKVTAAPKAGAMRAAVEAKAEKAAEEAKKKAAAKKPAKTTPKAAAKKKTATSKTPAATPATTTTETKTMAAAKKKSAKKATKKAAKKSPAKKKAAATAAAASPPAAPKKKAAKKGKAKSKGAAKPKSGSPKKRSPKKKAAAKASAPYSDAKKAPRNPAKKKAAKRGKAKAKGKSAKKTGKSKPKAKAKTAKKRGKAKRDTVTTTKPATKKQAKAIKKGLKNKKTVTSGVGKDGARVSVKHTFLANPIGNWTNVAVLGGGVVFGALVGEGAHRWWATRTPSGGKFPWYGTDAAHRILAAPDGIGMAIQGGVCVGFFALSMATQKKWVKTSYFFAGAFFGAASRFAIQLIATKLIPAVASVKLGTERTWSNRYFPLEQAPILANNAAKIDADNAATTAAAGDVTKMPLGQQDAGSGSLPAAYAFPTGAGIGADWRRRMINGAPGQVGKPGALPPPKARSVSIDARAAAAAAASAAMVGEPKAKKPGTTGCGGCGSCKTCNSQNPDLTLDEGARPNREDDMSNQACTDKNGNPSVTDPDGVCLENASPPIAAPGVPASPAPGSVTINPDGSRTVNGPVSMESILRGTGHAVSGIGVGSVAIPGLN